MTTEIPETLEEIEKKIREQAEAFKTAQSVFENAEKSLTGVVKEYKEKHNFGKRVIYRRYPETELIVGEEKII